MIKLAIIDDNHFLVKALQEKVALFPDLSLRLTCYEGEELLRKLEENCNLDLILMDIEMPELNGIELTEIIKRKYPHIKIIILTVFDNNQYIFNAIKAGADGYFLKDTKPKELYDGIIETLNGGAAMTPTIAKKTLHLLRNPLVITTEKVKEEIILSSRETEVLEQLATGFSYTIIAERLFISPSTVRKHIENIYRKLEVHTKLEAVEKARKNNMI